jgi:tripartite-type tricarboxylate transporter receptor subunit TctC
MWTLRGIGTALSGIAFVLFSGPSPAQSYPTKPIKFVNAFSPGGSSDTLARIIGQHLAERLGQPVLVESRTGAGGNIGADSVAKSAPDGHTLLMGTATFPVAVNLYRKMSFDLVKDLAPVTLIGGTTMLLVVHPNLPARTVAELVALAKAKPGDVAYATAGLGTLNHLYMELFGAQMSVALRHIPYRSNPLAMNDVVAGHVPVFLDFITTGAPQVRAGKVRALATTGLTRSALLPEVPTMIEAGVPNYEALAWFGVFASGGTPRAVINRLHTEIAAILAMPSVREKLNALGVDITIGDPDQLAALVKADIEKWRLVIQKAGIEKVD